MRVTCLPSMVAVVVSRAVGAECGVGEADRSGGRSVGVVVAAAAAADVFEAANPGQHAGPQSASSGASPPQPRLAHISLQVSSRHQQQGGGGVMERGVRLSWCCVTCLRLLFVGVVARVSFGSSTVRACSRSSSVRSARCADHSFHAHVHSVPPSSSSSPLHHTLSTDLQQTHPNLLSPWPAVVLLVLAGECARRTLGVHPPADAPSGTELAQWHMLADYQLASHSIAHSHVFFSRSGPACPSCIQPVSGGPLGSGSEPLVQLGPGSGEGSPGPGAACADARLAPAGRSAVARSGADAAAAAGWRRSAQRSRWHRDVRHGVRYRFRHGPPRRRCHRRPARG